MLYSNEDAVLTGLGSDVPCKTAADFLAHLSPQDREWAWVNGEFHWIYRGQRSERFALRPTALRGQHELAAFSFAAGEKDGPGLDSSLRALLERFAGELNRAGLEIPQMPQRHSGMFLSDMPRTGVFDVNEIPLMALARHHGVPTVLLDWSTRAYVAAYFAAVDAVRCGASSPGDRLAVWALDASDTSFGESGRLMVYRNVPASTNPNMHAQSGVFTIVRATVDDPFGNSVDGFCATPQPPAFKAPRLRRVTLPVDRARELLCHLAREGITGTSMFPGADGVVKAMWERAQWWDLAGWPPDVAGT
jgi:hypothetical protein